MAYCDNSAVVAVVNRRYCQDKTMMQLLRCLLFVEAHLQFQISASHIVGLHNELADDFSRNRLPAFRGLSSIAIDCPRGIWDSHRCPG